MKWKVEEDSALVNSKIADSGSRSEKGTSLIVGLGANYSLTNNIAFGLQWDRIHDVGDKDKLHVGETDIDLYTLSAQYKF